MSDSLPEIDAQAVIEVAFWAGALVFMLGSLWLIWLALAGIGNETSTESPDATRDPDGVADVSPDLSDT